MKNLLVLHLLFLSSFLLAQDDITSEITHATPASNCTNGAINLTISGGIAPYEFLWSNDETTEDVSNLEEGNYSVSVTDALCGVAELNFVISCGCQDIEIDLNVNQICNEEQGGALITGWNGATGDLTPTWTRNGLPFSENSFFIFTTAPGEYCVEVIDEAGCMGLECISIHDFNDMVTIDEIVHVNFCSEDPQCGYYCTNDGSISSTITAPANFTVTNILWTGPNFSSSNEDISNLSMGNYELDVTIMADDGSACVVTKKVKIGVCTVLEDVMEDSGCDEFTDTSGGAPVITLDRRISSDNGDCTGSLEISISISSSNSYTFSWTGPDGYTSNNEDIFYLCVGTYCVTADNGCGQESMECFDIVDCSQVNIDVSGNTTNACPGYDEGDVTTSVTGGTPPYDYEWSNGKTTANIENLEPGEYSLLVIDANGCTGVGTFEINSVATIREGCLVFCDGAEVENFGPAETVTNPTNCNLVDVICPGDGLVLQTTEVGTHVEFDENACLLTTNNNITGDVCPGSEVFGRSCRACLFGTLPTRPDLIINCTVEYCFFPSLNATLVHGISDFNNIVTSIAVGENSSQCHFQIYDNCTSPTYPVVDVFAPCSSRGDFPTQTSCFNVIPINSFLNGDPFGGCTQFAPDNPQEVARNREKLPAPQTFEDVDIDQLINVDVNELDGKDILIDHSSLCTQIGILFNSTADKDVIISILEDKSFKTLVNLEYSAIEGINTVILKRSIYESMQNGKYIISVASSDGNELREQIEYSCQKNIDLRGVKVQEDQISIYPNPFNDHIRISHFGSNENKVSAQLIIFNILGEQILSRDLDFSDAENVTMENLSHLTEGAYIIRIQQGKNVLFVDRYIKINE